MHVHKEQLQQDRELPKTDMYHCQLNISFKTKYVVLSHHLIASKSQPTCAEKWENHFQLISDEKRDPSEKPRTLQSVIQVPTAYSLSLSSHLHDTAQPTRPRLTCSRSLVATSKTESLALSGGAATDSIITVRDTALSLLFVSSFVTFDCLSAYALLTLAVINLTKLLNIKWNCYLPS